MYSEFGSGVSSGRSLFYRVKPLPTPQIKSPLQAGVIPVMRSGTKHYFSLTQVSSPVSTNYCRTLQLFNTEPSSLVASIDFATITTGGQLAAAYLSTTDQCLWCISKGTDNVVKVVKINDVTGGVTTLGTFTPITPANWPTTISGSSILFEDSGNLVLVASNKKHIISKSTGLPISQDNDNFIPTTTTPYMYSSVNGALYSQANLINTSVIGVLDTWFKTPVIYTTNSGFVASMFATSENMFGVGSLSSYVQSDYRENVYTPVVFVDNDKICTLKSYNSTTFPWVICYRSEYDALLQSVADYAAGVTA